MVGNFGNCMLLNLDLLVAHLGSHQILLVVRHGRKNLFEEIGQSFGNPNHSKCGKSTENSKMTRSPALVARLNLIGSQRSRDPKWRLLIGPCNDQGAVIGTLHNWKFNTSEIRFFTERIDIPGNRVLCYKVPSVDYRRIADCYRYCM